MFKDRNTELVKLAYTIAVEPHKLPLMQKVLDEHLQSFYTESQTLIENENESSGSVFENVEIHFQNAMELLERQGRQGHKNSVAISIINSDPEPAALIYPNGIIFHANQAAKKTCHFKEGRKIPAEIFDPKIYRGFLKDLRSLTRVKDNRLIGVYQCFPDDEERPFKFTLSKAEDIEGRPVGRITSINISWSDKIGQLFMESFKLTPVERDITQSLVTGISLSKLAKKRGRSLGTVRNQLKKLLSKLELRSQTELVSLYSSFMSISKIPYDHSREKPFLENESRLHFKMERSSGLNLSYEIVGANNKHPILYLHPIIGGTGLTPDMMDLIEKHNFRLIMSWRPYFHDTDEKGPQETILERYAEDLEQLLNHLEIDQCVILGCNNASLYAYAAAQIMPNRISGMVITAGAIPFTTREQFNLMSPQQRIPHYLAKHAPGMIAMYIRAILAMFDAGYDEEYIFRFFEDSPSDLKSLESSEFKDLLREAVSYAFTQGHKAVSTELILGARNWEKFLEGIDLPVTLVSGYDDKEFPIQTLEEFVEKRPNFELVTVENAGTFVIYQHPEIIFTEVEKLLNPL